MSAYILLYVNILTVLSCAAGIQFSTYSHLFPQLFYNPLLELAKDSLLMASRAGPSGIGPQPQGSKRHQVVVACERCRQAKAKVRYVSAIGRHVVNEIDQCDARRPECTRCTARSLSCAYNAEPDAPPIIALKRKHNALTQQTAEVNELLSQIKSVSQPDAYRIIDFLRNGKDVISTLALARTLPSPNAPGEQVFTALRNQNLMGGFLTAAPFGGYSSNASIALDLNAGRGRHDAAVSPEPVITAGPSGPLLPSFDSLMYDAYRLTWPKV